MLTNQILKQSLEDLKSAMRVDMVLYDVAGTPVAATFLDVPDISVALAAFVSSPADTQSQGELHFFKVRYKQEVEYILVTRGNSGDAYLAGMIGGNQIKNLLLAGKTRYERDSFYRDLFQNRLSAADIYRYGQKLRLNALGSQAVFLIETQEGDTHLAYETVTSLFGEKKDTVILLDATHIVLVKEMQEEHIEPLEIAAALEDTIMTEVMARTKIAYGPSVREVSGLMKSYEDAQTALKVGKRFYDDQTIFAYDKLAIGELIYSIPGEFCEKFLRRIWKYEAPETLTDDIIFTVSRFFENNLNISETARQLYIHRNTLVYRLEKVQKATGLDIRIFEDAMTFKLALMMAVKETI